MLVLISFITLQYGRKIALAFYVIGGLVFFVFNLNFFYPSYLGRKLINEETDQIKEALTVQKNNLNSLSSIKETEILIKLKLLYELKREILTEIIMRGGFGSEATRNLMKFKEIVGESEIKPERFIVRDPEKIEILYNTWEAKLDGAIKDFIVLTLPGEDKNKLEIVNANENLESFYNQYKSILDSIANDDKRIILDSLKYENYIPTRQIKTLRSLLIK